MSKFIKQRKEMSEIKLKVKGEYHKYLIGTGGKNIKEIKDKCSERFQKTPVTFDLQQQTNEVIIRSVSQDACNYAVSLIDNVLTSIIGVMLKI